MLVTVVMVFILCQVPALIYNMAYAMGTATETSASWSALSILRNFLVNLNSAVNFLLYCSLGQKFRQTFVRTFFLYRANAYRDSYIEQHMASTIHQEDFTQNFTPYKNKSRMKYFSASTKRAMFTMTTESVERLSR